MIGPIAVQFFGARGDRRRLKWPAFRKILADEQAGKTGRKQAVVVGALVIPAWVVLVAVAAVVGARTGQASPHTAGVTILDGLAGELALGGAIISVMRSWANEEAVSALAGLGLLAYGAYKLVVVSRSGATDGNSAIQIVGSISLVLAFGFLLLSVVHNSRRVGGFPVLTGGVAALVVALVGWAIVRPAGSGILSSVGSAGRGGSLILSGAWAVLGIAAIYVGRSERVQMKIWIGFAALCLAQARLALVLFGDPGVSRLASAVLATIAIAVTLLGSIWSLQESISGTRSLVAESLLALQGSETRRTKEASAHEEAVHNLRSALTSIGMATHMLVVDRRVPLSEVERSQLEVALESELERAKRLVSREWDQGLGRFGVRDRLEPLVVAERAQGTSLLAHIPEDLEAEGNPEKTYEIVATLLDNARRHAAGSPVEISARRRGGHIEIEVSDGGTGLPATQLDRIFERGWSTSPKGTGLGIGLYLARRLSEEQGGELTAANRPEGGACFTLILPAGVSDAA